MDTIVALSSGRPPAAIAVVRISGPAALAVAESLAGELPAPRRAGLRSLRNADGELLDRALVLVFPAPQSATGDDLVELHCHGGRAVVDAVEEAVLAHAGVRRAEAGEFTRRALENGGIDLAQAEGLADLLEAETQGQRRAALMASEGLVSRAMRGWLDRILAIAARVEASLEFAEEGDVAAEADLFERARTDAADLRREIAEALAAPPVERLRDGLRVVIAGPPNSGKSTLLNLMSGREAAIVSPQSGTTRDRIEAPVTRGGLPYVLTDTAGLIEADDPVERIGVARAEEAIGTADLLLWLGEDLPPRADAIWVHARADAPGRGVTPEGKDVAVSQDRRSSVDALWRLMDARAALLLPDDDTLPLRRRQRDVCARTEAQLELSDDPLIAAEQLQQARTSMCLALGLDATEEMLDTLFGRFCIGK